jgi:group I intron endonuclease
MNQGIIYAIYNKETGKYYIGQTIKELNKRWQEHLYEAKRMRDTPLYRSLRKYGADKFKIRVIEECLIDILDIRQNYWINEYNSYDNGYNQTNESDSQYKINESITEVQKSQEHVEKIKTTITNRKVGFTKRGDGKHSRIKVKTINVNTLEETYYDSLTECAEGLGIAVHNLVRSIKHGWKVKGHRIIKLEDKTKNHPIYGVDKITNKVLYTFPSIREASRVLGSNGESGCTKSLKHPHKYTWKGCYWFYQ